ncbi:MAG: PLP-dependent aminotransferase family protein, partial [Myxococcota bacterium]
MPKLAGHDGPRYLAIADALADDVTRGRLPPGTQMPTHRDLAEALGVTVGTVSRAYREARARGLVVGEVGRGTFVRGADSASHAVGLPIHESSGSGAIDLSLNFNRIPGMQSIVSRSLTTLAQDPSTRALFEEYHPQAGCTPHRAAGAKWIARSGLEVAPDQVLVTCGAQHAMTVALMAATRPGDGLLVGRLTYPAIIALARSLHLELHGVAMDEHGLLPDALEAACRAHKPRALYCMPTLQNPTTRVMPDARREQICEVATRHGLAVLEDDVYGFLLADAPPTLVSRIPHRGYYLTSLSKSLAPGLRVGYLALPVGDRSRFIDSLWATTVMAPPVMAELATRWIDDGTAAAMVDGGRAEAAQRQALAHRMLADLRYESHPGALQLWVELPPHWRPGDFAARAAQR